MAITIRDIGSETTPAPSRGVANGDLPLLHGINGPPFPPAQATAVPRSSPRSSAADIGCAKPPPKLVHDAGTVPDFVRTRPVSKRPESWACSASCQRSRLSPGSSWRQPGRSWGSGATPWVGGQWRGAHRRRARPRPRLGRFARATELRASSRSKTAIVLGLTNPPVIEQNTPSCMEEIGLCRIARLPSVLKMDLASAEAVDDPPPREVRLRNRGKDVEAAGDQVFVAAVRGYRSPDERQRVSSEPHLRETN